MLMHVNACYGKLQQYIGKTDKDVSSKQKYVCPYLPVGCYKKKERNKLHSETCHTHVYIRSQRWSTGGVHAHFTTLERLTSDRRESGLKCRHVAFKVVHQMDFMLQPSLSGPLTHI